MVTIEDISVELTKSVKELAEWNYPLSETLEAYYSLFNDTSNKGFGTAGLVLQNSTAVYVHRLDCLWNKTSLIRNVFFNYEQEAERKRLSKKKDRNIKMNFENFETINFAEDVDKNIDIKKSNIVQESVKSKTRCFTQLEKCIAQHFSIDIYDVNGEVIGKKYDFRCNQDINMNGVLVDEFAPEDFDGNNDNVQKKSTSSLQRLHNTESLRHSPNIITHDSSNKNISSDEESERNDNDSPEETSELVESLNSSRNLSESTDSIADTLHSSTTDNQDQSSIDAANQSTSHSDTNLTSNTIDTVELSSVLSNKSDGQNSDAHNIGTNVQDDDQLDSTIKSINSQEKTQSMDDSLEVANQNAELLKNTLQTTRMFQKDANTCLKYIREYNPQQYEHVTHTKEFLGFRLNAVESSDTMTCDDTYETSITLTSIENEEVIELYTPTTDVGVMSSSSDSKCKTRSRRKRVPKTPKKGRIAKKFVRKGRAVKNLLNELQKENIENVLEESVSSKTDRLSMFQQDLNTCMKYIQDYDPLQYDHVMDTASNSLGFRLRVIEACDSMSDDATDNTILIASADIDDSMLAFHRSPKTSCNSTSSEHETSCDPWLRSDSNDFLPKNIEKWHELLQPKLLEAERRSKFTIRHYTSRVMECLQTNTQHQINFDDVIPKEETSDVARYFLASLDLASRQKVDLIRSMSLGHSIQIALCEEDTQYSHYDQADSHD